MEPRGLSPRQGPEWRSRASARDATSSAQSQRRSGANYPGRQPGPVAAIVSSRSRRLQRDDPQKGQLSGNVTNPARIGLFTMYATVDSKESSERRVRSK